jgi:hypothetical protein
VPVVQISRIQIRRGIATDLPQLAAGELGWAIDEQKLYIGNGTVADGAPAVGNTEIPTGTSGLFSASTNYVYQGYLGTATPIVTGDGVDLSRTLQARLDETVSVKAFGAVGDASTDDLSAIQRAIDELYSDTDEADTRSHRILFFPAGTYKVSGSITIPRYAHLTGEGTDKTILYQTGGASPVAVTEDLSGNTFGSILSASFPTEIQISNLTFKNGEAYGGMSIDNATKVYFNNVKFQGTYASGGADVTASKGVTVRSTTALPCANIVFDQCQFTKFARLVDFDYDLTSARFINCDFSVGYYGAYIGDDTDGSTNGLTLGPSNIQFISSTWSTIGRNAIKVDSQGTIRNVISMGNWFASDIANDFQGYDTNDPADIFPVIEFSADECSSRFDYFERADVRSTSIAPSRDVDGVAIIEKPIKQKILADATSTTTTGIRVKATSGSALIVKYKIERGSYFRTGTFTVVGKGGTLPQYNDDYEETGDVGVTLTVTATEEDSTVLSDDETFTVLYTTTSTGSPATMDYQVTEIV